MRNAYLGRALLGLFIVSGFAGLIYQSIWAHYLGLVLGHAAYAQTLVLAIFMGGMAIGAWLASRRSTNWRHLILAYAVIEVAIGVIGLIFHPFFVRYLGFSQDIVLPALGTATFAHVYQWFTGALVIIPQSVLLGMTFPLLSAGYLRLTPDRPGEVLGGLYFSNSVGAALGALATAFVLLPLMGMPGTVMTAGLLNILVGIGAWVVWKAATSHQVGTEPAAEPAYTTGQAVPGGSLSRLMRIVYVSAALTGATSFVYEIGWVRLLNQALGTTVHSFELMLAAFIFGLACGGYWIHRRAARIEDAIRYAAWAQILMGLSALLSVVVFTQSFRWVGWMMQALSRSDAGYMLFSGGSGLVALLVMFPAAFFAGMTLPLFTLSLLRSGGGERQIGRVYASNTLGAIVGVLLMVHVLIPLMGVRLSIVLSALLDAGLGLYLLRCISPGVRSVGYAVGGAVTLAVTAVSLLFGNHDPRLIASGVFRSGQARLADAVQVPYLRDGKTASVSVAVGTDGTFNIATNGKPDAGLVLDMAQSPTADEVTMIMAGALPLALHPAPRDIAVIGWGSGLTTHTLLGSSVPRRVDTVEIERAIYDGARLFGTRNERAYKDPRSHLKIDDARTYFSTTHARFDVIVSEPSNPWVSGVASLFTSEFYGFIRGHLSKDGVFVQWVQAYELSDELLASMIAALLEVFPDSDLYVTNNFDLLIVGHAGERAKPNWGALVEEPLKSELARVGLASSGDFNLRRVGGPAVLGNYVKQVGVRSHSDYFPTVSLNAPRSRFKQETADSLLSIVDGGMPVAELLDGRIEPAQAELQYTAHSRFSRSKRTAEAIRSSLLTGESGVLAYGQNVGELPQVQTLLRLSEKPVAPDDLLLWTRLVSGVSAATLSQLPAIEQVGVWVEPKWISPAMQPVVVVDVLRALESAARRDIASMLPTALTVLAHPDTQVSPFLREQMLVQAQLAAIALGKPSMVKELDDQFGKGIPVSPRLGFVRGFVTTWTESER